MSDNLHYLSLDEVARRLKARKISSVEATQAMLDRIAATNPRLKAYATVTPERALRDAAQRDAELAAGKVRGPLHGVPIAVKDLISVRGVPLTAASRMLTGYVPPMDATVVERLRAAGATFVNAPRTEAYGRVVVFQDIFGNKWDLLGPTSDDR